MYAQPKSTWPTDWQHFSLSHDLFLSVQSPDRKHICRHWYPKALTSPRPVQQNGAACDSAWFTRTINPR